LFRKRFVYAIAGALLTGNFATSALADALNLTPSVSLKEEYNDNIFFSTVSKSSFISTLSPHLTLNEQSERLTALLDVGANSLNYSSLHELDSIDQLYHGQIKYRLTPQLNLQAKAGFDQDSRPDRFVETTGMVTARKSDTRSGNMAADMVLTEKLSGQIAYDYQQIEYDYQSSFVSEEVLQSISSGLFYDMSSVVPLLTLRTNLSFSTNRYSTSKVENYSPTVGFSYQLHELWQLQADVGGHYSSTTFENLVFVPPDQFALTSETIDDTGWVASLQLAYKGEVDSTSFGFTHNVQNASGRSSTTELTAVTAEVRHQFSSELSGLLRAGYYLNTSNAVQFSVQATDETTYRIRPALRYEFSRDMSLDVDYEFGIILYNQAGSEARRNKVSMGLSMKHSLFE
jgi:hypothetical protein